MQAALTATGIAKRFGAVIALSDGQLTVHRSEIHALLGANGCGKSTLCKIVAGTVVRDGGTIAIEGVPVRIDDPGDAEAAGIALFYQELSLVPQLSVADNIFLGREPKTRVGFVDRARTVAETEALIARFASVVGDGIRPQSLVSTLSPDQRQIVEVLKVLARKPKIIIFDEATAALDRRQVELFFAILRELKAQGVAIIFISHRLDEVFEISDRITVMRNGATVAQVDTAETDRDSIVHAMVGEMREHLHHEIQQRPEEATRLSVASVMGRRLRGVSFELRRGEILGLGGLQGQGQSTLLRGLFGAEPFSAGTVRIGARQVRIRNPADAIRHGIAYVSGDRSRDAAFHGRTILENIASGSLIRERRVLAWPSRLAERFERAAAALNTRHAGLNASIGSLSGGNQQKIFIARWLATSPAILLLDDPTKGIDLAAKADFFDLVRSLTEGGTSILFYTSEDSELLGLCDRVLVFNGGVVTAELSGATLTAYHLTSAAYGEPA